ncbi:MAG: hypothetical protein HY681_07705 [Chloroflexi bacterium]|nr:hypothetical protein [Chloroflexota bacterium]
MVTVTPAARGISAKNRKLLTALHRGTSGPFAAKDAAALLAFDIERAQRLLAYLARMGWLARIRRGLYATVPLDVIQPASWQEDPWIVAAKVFAPFYLGGWTACEHWGLTEQIFRETVVFTSRPTRDRHVEIQGFPFRVKGIAQDKLFGTEPVWRGQTKVLVSDPSRTIVDMLDDPSIGGGIRHVADVLETYLSDDRRNDTLLVEYIRRLGNRAVFKRLGYLLETLGVDNASLLNACREGMSSGMSLLDPSASRSGPYLRRWNLRLNVALEGKAATA